MFKMDISKHVITTVSVHLFTEKCCLALVYAGTGMRGCRVSHSAIFLQKDLGRYLWTMVSKGDTSAGKTSAEGTLVTPLFHPELQLSITPLLLGWLVSQPSTIHLGNFLSPSPHASIPGPPAGRSCLPSPYPHQVPSSN